MDEPELIETPQSLTPSRRVARTWFFGQWLVDIGAVGAEAVQAALELMKQRNVRLGDLAVVEKMLDHEAAAAIHRAQRGTDQRFGDLAVELGHLSAEQVEVLLQLQKRRNLKLGDSLIELGHFTDLELSELLVRYQAAVRARLKSNTVPQPFATPAVVCLLDVLPRTLFRAAQLRVKVGASSVYVDVAEPHFASCELYGPNGLRVCLAVGADVGAELAQNALQLPDDEPVPRDLVTETLQEVLCWLLETTAHSLGESGTRLLVGAPTELAPLGSAMEFHLAFTNGSGKVIVEHGKSVSPAGLRPVL